MALESTSLESPQRNIPKTFKKKKEVQKLKQKIKKKTQKFSKKKETMKIRQENKIEQSFYVS